MTPRGLATLAAVLFAPAAAADPPFRADGGDEKLPWFQLKPGEFPPPGSAHAVSGELIALDHVNRTGLLRPDRDDTQRRGDWDIPRPFVLLPFGSLSYHGAPAELRDIPIGTHLHGQFYADEAKAPAKKGQPPPPATFTRVARLEDDFSFHARQGRAWRVDAVAADAGTLTLAALGKDGKADGKPVTFKVGPAARVWKGKGFGTLADVAAGQTVQVNLTVCTLKGPGRVTDVWLDEESRTAATARQLEVHRLYQREHGLAGWVAGVDNKKGVVEVAVFGGVDPKLFDAFAPQGTVAAAVAEDSLRTWDQINDVKRGPVLAVDRGPTAPGDSGVRVRFKPSVLLEGYRPGRVVRLFPGDWKVDDLPHRTSPMRWLLALVPLVALAAAADPPAKITPGKVVIPTDKMRRIWGELVSIDPKTRTGTFRNESDDTVMPFTVMPYAELLHHAARGDLQDFKVGERAIFRLHEDADGKWVYLTYIQDEMNFQAGHKEYYWVDAVDPKAGTITFTQANADKSFVRDRGLVLETDGETRYWKKGKPAAFADIAVGDKLLAKTHGTGKGKRRVCWEVFLADESRDALRDEQRAVHAKRMEAEGLPGYVDAADGTTLKLTLFPEGADQAKALKAGRKVRVAPAGADRKPAADPAAGTVTAVTPARGSLHEVVVTVGAGTAGFKPTGVARLWAEKPE